MDRKTYDALQASIRHWEENLVAEEPHAVAVKGDACALCRLFVIGRGWNDCKGCPVRDAIGRGHCEGTPWARAAEAVQYWRYYPSARGARAEFRRAAQRELDFLRALVPAGGPDESEEKDA